MSTQRLLGVRVVLFCHGPRTQASVPASFPSETEYHMLNEPSFATQSCMRPAPHLSGCHTGDPIAPPYRGYSSRYDQEHKLARLIWPRWLRFTGDALPNGIAVDYAHYRLASNSLSASSCGVSQSPSRGFITYALVHSVLYFCPLLENLFLVRFAVQGFHGTLPDPHTDRRRREPHGIPTPNHTPLSRGSTAGILSAKRWPRRVHMRGFSLPLRPL